MWKGVGMECGGLIQDCRLWQSLQDTGLACMVSSTPRRHVQAYHMHVHGPPPLMLHLRRRPGPVALTQHPAASGLPWQPHRWPVRGYDDRSMV